MQGKLGHSCQHYSQTESSILVSAKQHNRLHGTNGILSVIGFAVLSEFSLYICLCCGMKPPVQDTCLQVILYFYIFK